VVVSGCSGSGNAAGNGGGGHPVSGGTLTAVVNADPGNLDPQSSVISTDVQFGFFAYDRLVSFGSDGSLQPNLAASWTSDSAGSQYVFTLRKGVTCSDGSPLTPATIAANLNYVANPKNASPLLGAAVPAGTTATADAGAGTVTVKLGTPAPFFVNDLTLLPIVCQKGLDDRGSLAHATDGTGPYVLAGASSGNQYTYTLRKDYSWGPAGATSAVAGLPATIVLKVVANETTAANLLLGGGAQIATVSGADRTRLSGAGLFHVGNPQILGELFFTLAGRPNAQLGSILFGTGAWEAGLVPVGVTDPSQGVAFLSGPTPPHGTNFAHIANPDYSSAVAQAQTHPGAAGCPQWDQAEISLLRAVDVVPFEDEVVQLWGKKATFAAVNGVVLPTSIRQLG
jgi:peptide/nickel transport system substrate-binding protein